MVYTPCRTGKPCSRAGQDSTHRRLRKEMHFNEPKPQAEFVPPLSFFEKCCILDDMPVAYCVIELVFDEDGHGVVFVFRYCNKHMEAVEDIHVEEMLNRSFYEVFKNGDRKWLISYAFTLLKLNSCILIRNIKYQIIVNRHCP